MYKTYQTHAREKWLSSYDFLDPLVDERIVEPILEPVAEANATVDALPLALAISEGSLDNPLETLKDYAKNPDAYIRGKVHYFEKLKKDIDKILMDHGFSEPDFATADALANDPTISMELSRALRDWLMKNPPAAVSGMYPTAVTYHYDTLKVVLSANTNTPISNLIVPTKEIVEKINATKSLLWETDLLVQQVVGVGDSLKNSSRHSITMLF